MDSIRNRQLFDSLRAYSKDALDLIRGLVRVPQEVPQLAIERIEIIEPDTIRTSKATEPDWSRLLINHESDLSRLSTYSEVAESFRRDPVVARHLDVLVGARHILMMRVNINYCLRAVLTRLLFEQESLSFDESKFKAIYIALEEYFYSDFLQLRVIAALERFEMDGDKIELGDNFFIIRMGLKDREEIIRHGRMLGLRGFSTGRQKFCFELSVEVRKVFGGAHGDTGANGSESIAYDMFQEAQSALRLFKSGSFSYSSIRVTPTQWDPHGQPEAWSSSATVASPGPKYTLSREEIPAFLEFWSDVFKGPAQAHKRIDLALRRLNYGYERVRPEDRLIDYSIALEALLLKKGEQQELAYRLALRGSALLGEDPGTRLEIFSRLKKAYNLRSDIVHGGTAEDPVSLGPARLPFPQFVEVIADDVRASLRKFLTLAKDTSESEVIAALDEKIVRGAE